MNARISTTSIAIVGEELAVAWSDNTESFFPLEILRRNCPCAVCQGEADVMGQVERPNNTLSSASFELKAVQPVGGYALQMLWGDGHNTGLYSFIYLRELGSQISTKTP